MSAPNNERTDRLDSDMSTATVFGKGNMGQAISGVLSKAGADVQIIGSGDSTPISGEIVILAVPYPALAEIAAQRGAELAGKVVVDISNPLDLTTFDSLVVSADSSATAELAAKLPQSSVLKAFNTTFAGTLVSGVVGDSGQITTVLVAGDDPEAKGALISLVTAGGLRALDAGSLRRARELEAFGFLQLTLASSEKIGWTAGFAVVS